MKTKALNLVLIATAIVGFTSYFLHWFWLALLFQLTCAMAVVLLLKRKQVSVDVLPLFSALCLAAFFILHYATPAMRQYINGWPAIPVHLLTGLLLATPFISMLQRVAIKISENYNKKFTLYGLIASICIIAFYKICAYFYINKVITICLLRLSDTIALYALIWLSVYFYKRFRKQILIPISVCALAVIMLIYFAVNKTIFFIEYSAAIIYMLYMLQYIILQYIKSKESY